MITQLTNGNKKQMTCPFCGESISWNTFEEKEVMGNRTIVCLECGENIIVPKTELQANYKGTVQFGYTNDIYSTEGDSSGSSSSSSSTSGVTPFYLLIDEEGAVTKYNTATETEEAVTSEQILAAIANYALVYEVEWGETHYAINNIQAPDSGEAFLTFDIIEKIASSSQYVDDSKIRVHSCSLTESEETVTATIASNVKKYQNPTILDLEFTYSNSTWECNHSFEEIAAIGNLNNVNRTIKVNNSSYTLLAHSYVASTPAKYEFYFKKAFSYTGSGLQIGQIIITEEDAISIEYKPFSAGTAEDLTPPSDPVI